MKIKTRGSVLLGTLMIGAVSVFVVAGILKLGLATATTLNKATSEMEQGQKSKSDAAKAYGLLAEVGGAYCTSVADKLTCNGVSGICDCACNSMTPPGDPSAFRIFFEPMPPPQLCKITVKPI